MSEQETFVQKKEVLESQIASLESHIKWEGIPAFIFISTFSALVWAFVQIDGFSFENLPQITLISIITSRIIWRLVQSDHFSLDIPAEGDLKIIEIFKKNVETDVSLDLALSAIGFWCIYLIQTLSFHGIVYFSISICLNVLVILVLKYVEPDRREKEFGRLTQISDSWIKGMSFVYTLVTVGFTLYGAYICLEVFGYLNKDLPSFKALLLFLGCLLLVKFYSRGRYLFTALDNQRNELTKLIRNNSKVNR